MALVLLSTEACHLCEIAQQVLMQVHRQIPLEVYLQDIAESEDMVHRYGEKIPVLLDEASGRELCWPFDAEQLITWLQNTDNDGVAPTPESL